MAKHSRSKSSSSEPLSDSSEDDDRVNDEEELDAVSRAGKDSEAEDQDGEEDNDEDEENEEDDTAAKPEKATLKEMQRLKKDKTQEEEVLDAQNADKNNKGKGRTLKRITHIEASQPQPDRVDESIGSSSFCEDSSDYSESDDQSSENSNARKRAKKLFDEKCMQYLISMKARWEQMERMLQQNQDLLQEKWLKAQAAAKKVELKR